VDGVGCEADESEGLAFVSEGRGEPAAESRPDALEVSIRPAAVVPAKGFDLLEDVDAGEVVVEFIDEVSVDLEVEGVAGKTFEVVEDRVWVAHGSSLFQMDLEAL
jgi:hypothetical protein